MPGPTNLTWVGGTETTVSAAAAIDSDEIALAGSIGFSLIVQVTGSGAMGISGNLELVGVNGGVEAVIGNSGQAVRVGAGQVEYFEWSFFAAYEYVLLRWTQAGAPDSGTLGVWAWNVVAAPVNLPAPAPSLPAVLPENAGTVVAAVDRLAQYLRGVPPAVGAQTSNVRAIIQIVANRFAEAGQAIQSIQAARSWAALASGQCTDLLHQIGKLVGAPPPGLTSSDAQFCAYVRASIAADHSSGGIEDMYAIARLILPSAMKLRVEEYPPAALILRVTDPVGLLGASGAARTDPSPLPAGADGGGYSGARGDGNSGSRAIDALAYFLRRARPGGVWAVVSYELSPDAQALTLDLGPGLDGGRLRGWQGP